jgi:hypothetical protein
MNQALYAHMNNKRKMKKKKKEPSPITLPITLFASQVLSQEVHSEVGKKKLHTERDTT